jgi:hypothetical protein
MNCRLFENLRWHQDLYLQQVAFPLFDQEGILIRQTIGHIASIFCVLARVAGGTQIKSQRVVIRILLQGSPDLALGVTELALRVVECGQII